MRRRPARIAFLALTVTSTLVLVTIGAATYYVSTSLHAVQANALTRPEVPVVTAISGSPVPVPKKTTARGRLAKKPAAGQPFTVLILGTDSRQGTNGEYGPGVEACGCSDTIILARVNPQTRRISLLSIPRDSRVTIADTGKTAKLNSAYGRGADNSVATIEATLGIPINHWVVIDLAGFKSLVDAIGGIKMDFPVLVRDDEAGLYPTKTGCQKINGNTALAISRARHLKYLNAQGVYRSDPGGEYGRTRREQILLRVIAAKTVTKSLSNPFTAKSVIDTFTSHDRLGVDGTVTPTELIDLASDFAGFDASTMQSFSLPTFTQSIYVPGTGNQDFEIFQQTKDIATIQAWYDAAQPQPKSTPTTASPKPATTPPAAVTSKPPSTTGSPAVTSATSPSDAVALPNQPQPYDPVPCA